MLAVGVEAGGYAQHCMVCAISRTTPHDALYVVLWERDMRPLVGAARQADPRFLGGCLRLCGAHLDELVTLALEVL
jgi:hypothetical protein